MTRPGNRKA